MFTIQGVFGFDEDISPTPLTIDEIQNNIQELNQTNISLDTRIEELQNSDVIRKFFREDLSQGELEELSFVINVYIENRKRISEEGIDESIILKKDLYKDMIPYIDVSRMESYLEYVQDDAQIIKQQDELNKEISKNKELLDSKVDFIETRIKDHRDSFSQTLQTDIEMKIDEKLSILRESSKFAELEDTSKISVLNKTIRKIKIRISNAEQISDRTDILETRLGLYYIILEKIEAFKSEIE